METFDDADWRSLGQCKSYTAGRDGIGDSDGCSEKQNADRTAENQNRAHEVSYGRKDSGN